MENDTQYKVPSLGDLANVMDTELADFVKSLAK